MDPRAADILLEYTASASRAVLDSAPDVDSRPVSWRDGLLATLDGLAPADARATGVIIVGHSLDTSMREAGRVARLHPDTQIFIQVASSEATDTAVFDRLHPFQQGLLVDGDVPEDAWTRVARHWHECFRLSHPVAPGDPKAFALRPWDELDQLTRDDNILHLRSILSAVAARGRTWVPAWMVPPGSFIELTDGDLEEVARVASWPQLPPGKQAELRESLRAKLTRLEDVGYVAIVPPGGPPNAAGFRRIGIVQARKLEAAQSWTRRAAEEEEELHGDAGDWHVRDSFGEVRTVGNAEFQKSHEPLDGELWRRVGTFSAWRTSEALVIRTKEGRATAHPGDWVVEGALGERWPISDEQFRRTYRPSDSPTARHGTMPKSTQPNAQSPEHHELSILTPSRLPPGRVYRRLVATKRQLPLKRMPSFLRYPASSRVSTEREEASRIQTTQPLGAKVNSPVLEPGLGSNLADLHDLPLGEGVNLAVATELAYQIMPQDSVSAFNSAI